MQNSLHLSSPSSLAGAIPATQSFDQLFRTFVIVVAGIYLARSVLGVTLLVVGALPTRFRQSARAAGARVTPRLMLKVISTIAGVLVATTGIGATTALAANVPSSTDDLIAIDRGPTTEKSRPQSNKARTPAKATKPTKAKSSEQTQPKHSAKTKQRSSNKQSAHTAARSAVTVRAGDTLWSVAAQHLQSNASDQQIDKEWRRWYSANKQAVGSDPNVIVPGMKLEAPGV